ncbi:precorrin-2 dehydrogenase/sirohydrochlorin ferrochelatase family protein [Sphingobacterium endophyticum]|uniref:precorrin-2 dehydrogenase/sirohydrochlorin ferrochelatase family protein n=1 Tax=Sphingobacterium endophyticum TaxID=2546448 RepID=UPI0012E28D2B|nr:bifunctional precorrin-2 dehydrogenase/sirohydrochlorin ferrochelatase [Sphingobacterium endophyticum]
MNTLFPIYVKLDQIETLLVGAGPVGLEKIQALIANSPNANVKVVAEHVIDEFYEFISDKPQIQLYKRSFSATDLFEKQLVILATNNPKLNNYVRELCAEHHILLNVADKPSLCDFYLGSVVQKGNLKIGISTNGKSPTIAKRLKEFLNDLLPEEIDETLNLMSDLRNQINGDLKDKIAVLNAHTEQLIKQNEYDRAN